MNHVHKLFNRLWNGTWRQPNLRFGWHVPEKLLLYSVFGHADLAQDGKCVRGQLPQPVLLGLQFEAGSFQVPQRLAQRRLSLLDGSFVTRAENVIALGLPGRGKSHFLAALGRELILRHKYAVLFTPTFKLVQQLLTAKRELRLEGLLRKLDQFDAVILDDLGYVQQDREEMEVLFTFLAERYERRSVLLSSNLVFSKWDQIFKDPMTTMAAIDRLVHHAIILEFNGESMRVPRDKEKEPGGS